MFDDRSVVVEYFFLPVGAFAERIRVVVNRGLAAVHVHLVHQHGVFRGVQHILRLPWALPSVGEGVVDPHLLVAALARGHENDSVGASGSVDCCRCRILENLHGHDVGRVEIVDVSAHWHSVDDVQRVAVIDCAYAPDAHFGAGAGLAGVLGYGDSRDHSLEQVVHAGACRLGEGVSLDGTDGGGDDALLLHAVAYDHHVVKHLHIFVKNDVECCRQVLWNYCCL